MPQTKKQEAIRKGIGAWTFLVGVVLAVILGLFSAFDPQTIEGLTPIWVWVLVILGIVVGLLNIAEEEVEPFLIASTVLIIASWLGADIVAEAFPLGNILQSLLALFVPATIIVAVKRVMELARH